MSRPAVTCDPGVSWGRAVIGHVPVEHVAGLVWADSVAAACEDYDLTRGQVLVACWYLAVHDRRWKRRWQAWVPQVEGLLAADQPDYEAIEDPPAKGAAG